MKFIPFERKKMLLTTANSLDQDRLDDIQREDSLIPQRRSHALIVFIPEALLEELAEIPPNQDMVFRERPQRKACHRLRKLVRSLTGQQRKVIRLLYFRGQSQHEVAMRLGLREGELKTVLDGAFARLRAGLT